MINKLKLKFIILTMISLFVLLAVLICGINLMSYNSIISDADEILAVLSHNRGTFPEPIDGMDHRFNRPMSPEAPYESRFFTVLMDEYGNVIQTNTSKIKSIGTQEAIQYSRKVFDSNSSSGFIDIYRYTKAEEPNGIRIIFLDCRKQLDSFHNFLYSSIIMSAIGYVAVFCIIFFCSGKIIRPISESYEKQKRFITDAGHEIKTPLTIINANTDILEAEKGSSEYIDDIRTQTKRLADLTSELVYLAKMEETDKLDLIDVPFSEIVGSTAENFKALALQKNINVITEIEPLVTVQGNVKSLEQLINILFDNAIKYTPESGNVKLRVAKQGKNATLTLQNTTTEAIGKDSINKIFDRFYRSDLSRNSETGGYGIGLSIAKAVTEKHSGKISAEITKNNEFKITVSLPV